MAWRDRAACRGMGHHIFFPNSELPDAYNQAREICSTCPVQRECLEDAATFESSHVTFGMRGGLVPRQRDRWRTGYVRKSVRYRRCEVCGETFAYRSASRKFCSDSCRQRTHRDQWPARKRAQRERQREAS